MARARWTRPASSTAHSCSLMIARHQVDVERPFSPSTDEAQPALPRPTLRPPPPVDRARSSSQAAQVGDDVDVRLSRLRSAMTASSPARAR